MSRVIEPCSDSDTGSEQLDFDIPQNIEGMQKVLEEAKSTKNKTPQFPENAEEFDVVMEINDVRLRQTSEDGACCLYTLFYIIYRDPVWKRAFHSQVRKDTDNYYFYLRVSGDMYTFRIPISLIIYEKENDKNRMYPTDWEYANAVSILSQVITLLKMGWIDRCAYQVLQATDMFFDRPFDYLGINSEVVLSDGVLKVITSTHSIELRDNGEVNFNGVSRKGHQVFFMGFYPPGFNFGHAISIYFDYNMNQWTYYSCWQNTKHQFAGEQPLSAIVPWRFNSISYLCDMDIE